MGKKNPDREQQARERMAVILQVRSGQLTAMAGAKLLGVSRKTYYQIEKKALEGMMRALLAGQAGRPAHPRDLEKEQLQQELKTKEKELLISEAKLHIKDLFYGKEPDAGSFPTQPGKKKR